jgi:branched-chain amino acid transport system substrate-binding protein
MKRILLFIVSIWLLASCSSDKTEFRVGVLTPLTSVDGSTYGEATQRGIELAAEFLERNKDFSDLSIKIVYEDTKFSSTVANSALEKLVTFDNVNIIIGPFSSSVVQAVSSKANEYQVPVISASATADYLKEAGEYIFRNVPTNLKQGSLMAEYCISTLGIKEDIVVYYLNNEYGISCSKSFINTIENNGGKITLVEQFTPRTTDFRTTLLKIKNLNPKFIYIPDHYDEAGLLLKQAKELGLNTIFAGGDGSYSPKLAEIAGSGSEDFLMTLMFVDKNSNEFNEFEKLYINKYGESPDVYSAYAYDAFLMVAHLYNEMLDAEIEINKQTILKHLNSFEYKGITGITKFDEFGEVNKEFSIYKLNNRIFKQIK